MAVAPALTGTELTNLAKASALTRYLSYAPDTSVATARVNQATFIYPLAQITVDGTSAGWSSIEVGQTVYIGSTAGARDRGVYRVRKTPSATVLYLQEMGEGDPGNLPLPLRTAGIADNDYVTVIQRWDIESAIPRIDISTSTVYEDYDLSPGSYNTVGAPIVNLTVNGIAGGFYATYTSAATVAITAVASVTHFPTTSGATYLWTAPSGWTSVSGTTSATLTANAAPGNYVLKLVVTPSAGNSVTRLVHVNVHDKTNNPPLYIAQVNADQRDRTGRRMTLTLHNNSLASLPDGAFVCYFEMPTWSGSDAATATRTFCGWVERQGRDTEPGLRGASIDIISVTGVLAQLDSPSHYIEAVASPTKWTEVVASLSTESFMVWYLLKWRAPNVLKLFNLTVFSTTAAGQRLPTWRIDQGSLLGQIQQLATERGNFGANSAGELFYLRHPNLIPYASRSSVVQRDTLTSTLYTDVGITRALIPRAQQVRGEAFSWDGSATIPTPYLSDAPQVPGQGGAGLKLPAQVVDAQSTLNQLTGDYYANLNNPYPDVRLSLQKNRDVYEPAELPFVTVTIPAALSPDGAEWSRRCIPVTVSKRHNADGTSDIEMTLEAETTGIAGTTVLVPAANTGLFIDDFLGLPPVYDPGTPIIPLPSIEDWGTDFDLDPDDEQDQPVGGAQYGRIVGATSDGRVWVWEGDGSGGGFTDISPTAPQRTTMGTLYGIRHDPYALKRYVIWGAGGIAYTDNAFAASPTWSVVTFASGTGFDFQPALNQRNTWYWLYTSGGNLYLGRSTNFFSTTSNTLIASYNAGDVTPSFTVNPFNWREVWVAAGKSVTGSTTTYDFTASDGGWAVSTGGVANYSAGNGWEDTYPPAPDGIYIASPTFAEVFIADITVTFNTTFTGTSPKVGIYERDTVTEYVSSTASASSYVLTVNRLLTGFSVIADPYVGDTQDFAGYITGISFNTEDSTPSLFRSTDGGTSFTQSIMLDERGGCPWWNWATQTANVRNTTTTQFRHIQGIDGSDNITMVAGITGSSVTIVSADATQYPETGLAFGFLARDLDYGWYLARTGDAYKTSNGGTSWSAVASITGGASFVVWGGFQYPPDNTYWGYYGYRCLGYTIDSGTNWVSLWTDYDTFRTATYTSDNETIVGAVQDTSPHYVVPPGR